MYKLLLTSGLLLMASLVLAQADQHPVTWSFSLGKNGDVHAVLAQAEVAEGWYVYSQFLDEGGPIPTTLDLSLTSGLELSGLATEDGDVVAGFDELFEMQITKFKHHANFTQTFSLAASVTEVVGTLEFMACTNMKCLPPQTIDIALPVAKL